MPGFGRISLPRADPSVIERVERTIAFLARHDAPPPTRTRANRRSPRHFLDEAESEPCAIARTYTVDATTSRSSNEPSPAAADERRSRCLEAGFRRSRRPARRVSPPIADDLRLLVDDVRRGVARSIYSTSSMLSATCATEPRKRAIGASGLRARCGADERCVRTSVGDRLRPHQLRRIDALRPGDHPLQPAELRLPLRRTAARDSETPITAGSICTTWRSERTTPTECACAARLWTKPHPEWQGLLAVAARSADGSVTAVQLRAIGSRTLDARGRRATPRRRTAQTGHFDSEPVGGLVHAVRRKPLD